VGVTTLAQADVFVVRSVTVRGNARLSTGEVLTIIDGLKGESLFKADLGAYRARLLDSPWVADAAFRRVLPSTIELSLTERAPMAIGRLGDQLFLVDAGGVIIDEYGPQYAQYDLPIVDGLVTAPSAGAPAIKARVAQFDVANAHDVVALVDQDPVWLHLGDRDFAARVRRYLELAPTLKGEHDDIDYVDLRFEERIYMRNRSTAKKD
jgi:cell division protein FtsQ